ncbi:uncharacterized protein LOC126742033 [Anthonomus grandis grandis]|uniref:uncharacterized protein LOC126742033 n=1 Tax=Anthonomus grandis grandis TaxID=2921223 RepID=UPI0021665CAD|nr:uncharacterized protein LOC126742033 [Anthonomus grandis grandis]
MPRKVHVNRLNKDEVIYELAIRGIAEGSVEEMRPRLPVAFQLERNGDSVRLPEYPFSFEEDALAVYKKTKEVSLLVGKFSNGRKSGEFMKLQTKLSHILNRLDHMDAGDDKDKGKSKSELVGMVLTLLAKLEDTATKHEREETIPPGLNLLESQAGGSSTSHITVEGSDDDEQVFNANLGGVTNSSPIPRSSSTSFSRVVLPSKWNLQFSGDKKGLSLSAFLEKVEELRIARQVPKEILLESGIDLFTGKAYRFYLAYRRDVPTWDEFIFLLREEFQPCNYNEKLFDEICKRTQGQDESIGIYLAVMAGYFKRLTCPISEEAKLKILLRNLAPFNQSQMALIDVTSISRLRTLCRRLEERREAVESYSQPSRRGNLLEPDLAYIYEVTEIEAGISTLNVNNNPIRSEGLENPCSEIICFRCKKPGHRAIGCTLPRPKFCFRCKKDGVTVKTLSQL